MALVTRWLMLTRDHLPQIATAHGWPIERDHCFMRVFLDHAAGARWDTVVARPAIRHMPLPMLTRAVAMAEAVLATPASLPALNAQSLAWRRDQRRVAERAGGRARGRSRGRSGATG